MKQAVSRMTDDVDFWWRRIRPEVRLSYPLVRNGQPLIGRQPQAMAPPIGGRLERQTQTLTVCNRQHLPKYDVFAPVLSPRRAEDPFVSRNSYTVFSQA